MSEKTLRRQRACTNCGTLFEIGPRERNPRKWCSRRCRGWAQAHPGEPLPAERTCQGCGVDITDRPLQALFCSNLCNKVSRGWVRPEPYSDRRCALPECGATFTPFREGQRCCSEKHGKALYNRESRADGRQANPWSDRRRNNKHRRRARQRGAATGEPVIREEIAIRDGWRCHLCRKPVDPALAWPDPMSASIDHLVPLSLGGPHDPANVRLAHLRCNTSKGNRAAGEQLLLFG